MVYCFPGANHEEASAKRIQIASRERIVVTISRKLCASEIHMDTRGREGVLCIPFIVPLIPSNHPFSDSFSAKHHLVTGLEISPGPVSLSSERYSMEAQEKDAFRLSDGSAADLARLIDQHNAFVQVVKLVNPYVQLNGDERVLDIGCGPGSWVLDVAFQYPDMSVIGLDIDENAVNYAMARREGGACRKCDLRGARCDNAASIS